MIWRASGRDASAERDLRASPRYARHACRPLPSRQAARRARCRQRGRPPAAPSAPDAQVRAAMVSAEGLRHRGRCGIACTSVLDLDSCRTAVVSQDCAGGGTFASVEVPVSPQILTALLCRCRGPRGKRGLGFVEIIAKRRAHNCLFESPQGRTSTDHVSGVRRLQARVGQAPSSVGARPLRSCRSSRP